MRGVRTIFWRTPLIRSNQTQEAGAALPEQRSCWVWCEDLALASATPATTRYRNSTLLGQAAMAIWFLIASVSLLVVKQEAKL